MAVKHKPGSFLAFLSALRTAGSGTPEADTAVKAEGKRAEGAGLSRESVQSVWQRLRSMGLWLQGDGEPAALTPKGLTWLNERTA